ncbi:MAG: hypothetical protein FWH12_09720 [Treponema sp.]|nr:hypothetical protein [Treponema sp.]
MDLQFRIRASALKHGVTEADIRHAFDNYGTIRQFHDRENVYLLIGFDLNANPIEILYNEFGENGVNVFHAMECQPRFLPLLNEKGSYYDRN